MYKIIGINSHDHVDWNFLYFLDGVQKLQSFPEGWIIITMKNEEGKYELYLIFSIFYELFTIFIWTYLYKHHIWIVKATHNTLSIFKDCYKILM